MIFVIQMCYLLQGSKGEALVSVVYSKKGLGEKVEYIGIDWMDNKSSGQLLNFQLIGDSKKFTIKNSVNIFSNHILKKFT